MQRVVRKKRIVILHKGLIYPLGISGPHTVPYWENIEMINKLVMGNYKVYEVLNDGTRVALDYTNYDKENGDPNNPSMQITYETYKSIATRRRDKDNKVKKIEVIDDKTDIQKLLKRSTEKKPTGQTIDLVGPKKVMIDQPEEKTDKKKRPVIDAIDDK